MPLTDQRPRIKRKVGTNLPYWLFFFLRNVDTNLFINRAPIYLTNLARTNFVSIVLKEKKIEKCRYKVKNEKEERHFKISQI